MLWLLCLTFSSLSAAKDLELNTSLFHVPRAQAKSDVSLCVRKILQDITENDGFIRNVILMNVTDALQIHKLHGIKKARFLTRSFSWTNSTRISRIYVTNAADFQEFKTGMILAENDFYFNPRANFIIVLENFKEGADHDKMVEFLVFYNIFNVTILARDDNDADYRIYSFQSPVHPCNQEEKLVVVSHCSSYEKGSNIFSRIEGVRGCTFKIMTYNLYPLINLDDPKEEGIEQRVLRYFEKYADVKIRLIPYSRADKHGQIIGNFTYTDILKKVRDNDVEGAVGGYFLSSLHVHRFSFSYPLTIDHMMVVLPRSNFEGSWQAFFNQRTLVISIVFTYIVFSIAAYILSLFPAHHKDLIRDTLLVFGYFLNKITIYKFKTGIPEKIILGSFLFSIFMIPFLMQSYLWSIKTHPVRAREAKTFGEVYGYRTLILTSEWIRQGIYKDRLECDSIIDCLTQVRDRKDKSLYTFQTEESYKTFKWILADDQCNLGLYILKEPIIILMRSIFFRSGSVLQRVFDEFTFKLIASGIIDQHYEEIAFRERLKCKPQHVPAIAPLEMTEFQGSFKLLLAGVCVSAVSFAFEVLTYRT